MSALGALSVREISYEKSTIMTISSTGLQSLRRPHLMLAWLAASSLSIVACAGPFNPSEHTPLMTDSDGTEGSDESEPSSPWDDEGDDDGAAPGDDSRDDDTGGEGLTDGDDPMDDAGGTSTGETDDSGTSSSTGSEPEESLDGQVVMLRAKHSDRCVEIPGGATSDGVNLAQGECLGLAHQQWLLEAAGPFYRVRSLALGKCASVANSALNDGAQIQQWPCVDEPNQLWTIEVGDDGSARFIGVQSGRCIDVVGGSHDVGAFLWQIACHDKGNQEFFLD